MTAQRTLSRDFSEKRSGEVGQLTVCPWTTVHDAVVGRTHSGDRGWGRGHGQGLGLEEGTGEGLAILR